MNRNASYLVIITLSVIAVVASLELYRQHQRESGLQINVGGKSISIETR